LRGKYHNRVEKKEKNVKEKGGKIKGKLKLKESNKYKMS
jgi:hypothetical protein